MAIVIKKTLVLGFVTSEGKSVNLTINAPKEGLSGVEVASAMEQIISSNALGEEGTVTQKSGAKYVIQEVDEITLS